MFLQALQHEHLVSLLLGFSYFNFLSPVGILLLHLNELIMRSLGRKNKHTKKPPVIQSTSVLNLDSDALNQQDSVWHYGWKTGRETEFLMCNKKELSYLKSFCYQEIHFKPSSSV